MAPTRRRYSSGMLGSGSAVTDSAGDTVSPRERNERAVSMHVYSRPIDSCVVFDMDAQTCYRRDLKYDYE